MSHPSDEILKLRIPPSLKNEVREFSELQGEPISVIVRLALREYMARHKEDLQEHLLQYSREESDSETTEAAP